MKSKSEIIEEFFEKGLAHINVDEVTPEVIKEVSGYFGKLLRVAKYHIEGDRQVQSLSGTTMFGDKEVPWHNDFSYGKGDFHGTCLGYVDCDFETFTEFVDGNEVWEDLGESAKVYFSQIECTFRVPGEWEWLGNKAAVKMIEKNVMTRQLAMVHPITNKTSLYLSPLTLAEATKPIKKDLMVAHCEKYSFKHWWKPGDIILWDNRRMMHRRDSFVGHRQFLRSQFQYEFNIKPSFKHK
jgi:alpha-ketoglutarate-dependent taurine dioxygenase